MNLKFNKNYLFIAIFILISFVILYNLFFKFSIYEGLTLEEQAKSDADKAQLNKDIESMVNQLPKFNTFDEAKQKITKFINE